MYYCVLSCCIVYYIGYNSVLQYFKEYHTVGSDTIVQSNVLQCTKQCYSCIIVYYTDCLIVYYSALRCTAVNYRVEYIMLVFTNVLQCFSALQCITVSGVVLQFIVMCNRVEYCIWMHYSLLHFRIRYDNVL